MVAKKKSAKKAGKTAGKKASKKASKKAGKTAGKKASKKASKKAPAKKSSAKKAAQKPAAATISSLSVNMGHVFALRPRTNSSFRPGDFMTAKHQLQDESYASLPEAARAVAERALELTHDSGSRVGTRYDRR